MFAWSFGSAGNRRDKTYRQGISQGASMTRKKVAAAKVNHQWSADALLAKAQRYAQEMLSHSADDWHFGLISTFVLEFLARAALAKINPTLLADAKDWNNIYFALGRTPTAPRFIPRSIDVTSVLTRLREILPDFTPEQEGFAAQHVNRRNEELHTGGTPFDGVKPIWLAPFYQTCKILLNSLGEDLALLVGKDESKVAETLIVAFHDQSAKAVMKAIATHKNIWESTSAPQQSKAARQASTWATRQTGHRVICPACGNDALVTGTPVSEPLRKLDADLIIETQQHLPAKFECVACQLKISGLSQLSACGLGAPYKSTSTYDAADYFAFDDKYQGFDDDNNEY
jgi:hypothetical protein